MTSGSSSGRSPPEADHARACVDQRPQLGAVEQRVLPQLAETGAALAIGERGKRREAARDQARLVERADEVLAGGQIDCGLAADRGVGHRDECRRQLDDRDAAVQRRCDEAREVADDATAERDDGTAAIEAARDELLAQRLVDRERLARLAGLDRDRIGIAGVRGGRCDR